MIRFAGQEDLPALSLLWREAFDADEREASFYFARRYRPENTLVALQNGEVAGMLTMLPAELITGSGTLPVRYVFAVATFKAFRGQGFSTRLLAEAHSHMRQTGAAASVLVPATPSLFDFYAKRGYENYFYVDTFKVSAAMIAPPGPAIQITDCEADDYLALRDTALAARTPYLRWDGEALRYITEGFRQEGGGALMLRSQAGRAACLYERREGGVRLTECLLDGLDLWSAMAALHSRLSAPQYTVRLPGGTLPDAETLPFGMVKWFSAPAERPQHPPYLSLAKD